MDSEYAKKLMLKEVAKVCIKDYIIKNKNKEIESLFEKLQLLKTKTIGEC